MLYLIGVLVMVIGIGASIALHEVGHLVPAKRFGVRVPQYMVGFGPTLWSTRRGETEYGVKAIPLGGYVRMIGVFKPNAAGEPSTRRGRMAQMVEDARAQSAEEIEPGDDKRVFYALSVPKKITIMLGGPMTNIVIALVLFTGIFTLYGVAQASTTVRTVSQCVDTNVSATGTAATECTPQMPKAPAAEAGFLPGDTITAVNGEPVTTWDQIREDIRVSGDRAMSFTVERKGETLTLDATPMMMDRPRYDEAGRPLVGEDGKPLTERVGFLGAAPSQELVKQPITAVPGMFSDMVGTTVSFIGQIPSKLVGVGQAAFGSAERDVEGPMSVVGVGRVAGEVASSSEAGSSMDRFVLLISLIAGLNLVLGILNLIPLLPLDGGHVAGAIWEGIKKGWARLRGLPDPGPVDTAKALPLAYTVALAFIAMTVLLVYADIVKPVRLTG